MMLTLTASQSQEHQGLSVVICSYERYSSLQETIGYLLMQSRTNVGSYEIIVVDNSRDQSKAKTFAAQYQGIEIVRYLVSENVGLSNARNMGLQAARFSYVAFVDDDVAIPPHWAEQITACFTTPGRVVAVAAGRVRLRFPFPKPDWLSDRLLVYLGHFDLGNQVRDLSRGENVLGCNMAFRRDRLLELGGFDLRLGRMRENLLSNDDVHITQRLHKRRERAIYVPDAELEHLVDPSRLTMYWFRQRLIWQAKSDYLLGGNQLRMRIIRAHFRRLAFPLLRLFEQLSRRKRDDWLFYLEAESAYDTELLTGPRT